jgi:hypothetical protein
MKPGFVNLEIKQQSKQWMHTFTKIAKKFKQTSATKLMATGFWDRKRVLMVEFMEQGTTIMSEVYCKTLKKRKLCEMLTFSVVLFHDNEHQHTSTAARISTGTCLTTLLTALISLRATMTCLPT